MWVPGNSGAHMLFSAEKSQASLSALLVRPLTTGRRSGIPKTFGPRPRVFCWPTHLFQVGYTALKPRMRSFRVGLFPAGCFLLAPLVFSASAQTVLSRITTDVNNGKLQTLSRNVHPLARTEFDAGPASADLPMNRMLMVLSRSPAQETDLKALLDAQLDPSSPQFHHWLTAEQFGARFGAADVDIQTVTTWLQSQGFTVDRVSSGKTIIEFSGTAGQVRQAFHTEIHQYVINGQRHWANQSDPQIPAALAPVISGVATMHNFLKKTQLVGAGQKFTAKLSPEGKPQFTASNGLHALSPGDLVKIYNVQPLITFTSLPAVAIVGRSNIQADDVIFFGQYFLGFGHTPYIVVNGPDPGDLGGAEEAEAVLDTSWASFERNEVELVVSKSTNSTDGVDLSEEYIIDHQVAPIMSESFGACEADFTAAQAQFYSTLAEQAATEGITYLVAAGDSGSAGCDLGSDTTASGPLSVNLLASNPYVTAVGGTEFNDNQNPSAYWSATNTNNSYSVSFVSALSYIPENAWNESCTAAGGSNSCPNGISPGLWSGGGGASSVYPKPMWQTGVPGIPNDGARDVPDVSLTAAGHDPYLICLGGSCQPNSLGEISFYGYAGTSAATPAFASMMVAIVYEISDRLGMINPLLYQQAAAETLGNCNASNTSGFPASTCIFNDITLGNNSVPGQAGYNTASGTYQAGVGYDLATGLGSINHGNLVEAASLLMTGAPVLSMSTNTLNFGTVVLGSSSSVKVTANNVGTGVLKLINESAGDFSISGCTFAILPGRSCELTFTWTPSLVFDPATNPNDYASFDVQTNGTPRDYILSFQGRSVATNTATLSSTSLDFGSGQVGRRTNTQTLTLTNSTTTSFDLSQITVGGSNAEDFAVTVDCPQTIWGVLPSKCNVYISFTPLMPGPRSATLTVPVAPDVTQTVPVSGTGLLTGSFEIVSMLTAKVLEVDGASTADGASVQQNALNGFEQQQWQFVPTGDGYFYIQNVLTGKVLDVTGGYTTGGTLIQQWDNLSGINQQWQLVAVDDVHYAIINRNSGLALDVVNGSTANGANIQQWTYVGDQQQLWVLVPVQSYNVANNLSSYLLDVPGGSTQDGTLITQSSTSGYREQQWQFVAVGGGYYAILNRDSGKVLDVYGGSLDGGALIQQWDYLGGQNQQWQIVPVDATNFKIVNRQSGKTLDDINSSTQIGTFIQQWDYVGGQNQQWQITPVTYYNIVNRQSGIVLDVVNGSTADGANIQQWPSNGYQQQQWQLVLISANTYQIMNNLTSKVLDIPNSSTADGALVEQNDSSLATASQFWEVIPIPGSNYNEIQNLNSRKVFDMTGGYLYGGALLQQWDYLGGANQQWRLVTVP